MDKKWDVDRIPPLGGKHVVITGANSGLGYETALVLAGKGALVTMAVRNLDKAEDAIRRIKARYPQVNLEVIPLDLADLSSIRRCSAEIMNRTEKIDCLINNAGLMAIPYKETVDGFEMQIGTNFLGHFALTGLLFPLILKNPGCRVITVSSLMHYSGKINLKDLNSQLKYDPWAAYAQSKLADLLFAFELHRRLTLSGHIEIRSLAAHPGYSATNLQSVGPQMQGSRVKEKYWKMVNGIAAQNASMGALPILYAAVEYEAQSGDYIGPQGLFGGRGYPGKAAASKRSRDLQTAIDLWEMAQELTGVKFSFT